MIELCSEYLSVQCIWMYAIVMSRTRNVKELLARSGREIWSLSDWNWFRTKNHLVRKWTLNHLAKLAFNGWVFIYEPRGSGFESSCSQILRLLRARSSLTFRQLQSVDSLWNTYVTWQDHTVKNNIVFSYIAMLFINSFMTEVPII